MSERLDAIQRMLEQSPDDAFLIYSMGMELAAAGRAEEAVRAFRRCIELDAQNVAAYTEAGKALRAAGLIDEAWQTWTEGLTVAERLGQAHARDYLQQLLETLPPRGGD